MSYRALHVGGAVGSVTGGVLLAGLSDGGGGSLFMGGVGMWLGYVYGAGCVAMPVPMTIMSLALLTLVGGARNPRH